MGDAGGAGRCAGATSAAPGARGGQHGGAGPAPLGEGGGRQGPAAAHLAEDSPPPPLDGAATHPLLGTVRTKSSGLHHPSMGREGGQGSSDRGSGERAPVGELAAMGSLGGLLQTATRRYDRARSPFLSGWEDDSQNFYPRGPANTVTGWRVDVQCAVQRGAGQCRAVQGRACTCQNRSFP